MGRQKLCRLIILLKAGEAAGRPRLSTFSAAILNGWQKLGSQKEAANDRKWVLPAASCRTASDPKADAAEASCRSWKLTF
jgi:hypothetical protein